jgi:hypothetical protein
LVLAFGLLILPNRFPSGFFADFEGALSNRGDTDLELKGFDFEGFDLGEKAEGAEGEYGEGEREAGFAFLATNGF